MFAKTDVKKNRRATDVPKPHFTLSVIVPCYNEQEVLPEFHRRMTAALKVLGGLTEIIYVNDGSKDGTALVLSGLSSDVGTDTVVVSLSRNHGHQLAVTAGLAYARGERTLIIDADLQDPPELIQSMMQMMDRGVDVVYGKRRVRKGETAFKRGTASLFYALISKMTGARIPRDTGDFRLINKRVLEILNAMPEQHRFLRGMVAMIGFEQVPLEYDRDERFAGVTKYPLRKMVSLAIDGITGFASAPLRIYFYLSGFAGVIAVLLGLWTVYSYFAFDAQPGWASLMATLLMFSSIQMFGIALIGEYVGRTFIQAKGRPLFLVKSVSRNGTADEVPA